MDYLKDFEELAAAWYVSEILLSQGNKDAATSGRYVDIDQFYNLTQEVRRSPHLLEEALSSYLEVLIADSEDFDAQAANWKADQTDVVPTLGLRESLQRELMYEAILADEARLEDARIEYGRLLRQRITEVREKIGELADQQTPEFFNAKVAAYFAGVLTKASGKSGNKDAVLKKTMEILKDPDLLGMAHQAYEKAERERSQEPHGGIEGEEPKASQTPARQRKPQDKGNKPKGEGKQ